MQGHTCFHTIMQRIEGGAGNQVDMHTHTDACTHPNQGVALKDYQDYPGIDLHNGTTYKISTRGRTVHHGIGTTASMRFL